MTGPRLSLVLPDLDGGGAQRVFLDLAVAFRSEGADVEMVTFRRDGPLRDRLPPAVALTSLGDGRVAAGAPAFVRHLRRRRPDYVISALNHVNLLSLVAARLARPRIPVMVTHHNHLSMAARHKERRRDRAMPLVLGRAYARADQVVAVSHGVADDLAATTGLDRSRIDVIYNPVRFDDLVRAGREETGHPWVDDRDAPLVVASGRLVAQKDFATLIRAVARLPHHRLVILGDGPLREDLVALAASLGIADRVDLVGFVANPFAFLSRADVFALSSRWEGLPTVLVEALAFPAAIVATDCRSGPREILDGGRWGALVPVGDVDALAAALGEAPERGPAGDRAEAMAPYAPARVAARYLELLTTPA